MNQIDVLLMGDATDGPLEQVVPVGSFDELVRGFGGYSYEQTTVSSGQTSYTLGSTPWANRIEPLSPDPGDGALVRTRLYEFSPSGAALTFSSLGQSQSVTFRTLTLPGPTSLLKGVYAARGTGARLAVVRLGTQAGAAVASSGVSGGFQFIARFAGARYNNSTIVVSGNGAVIVTPAAGTGRVWTYTPASDWDLRQQLSDEVVRGRQSLFLTGASNKSALTIPAGTWALSGGGDGTLTASGVVQFLTDYDLAGVDVICPVGLLTTDVSGAVLPALLDQDYPALLVAQAPASGDALSGMVNSSARLVSVAFQLRYDGGRPEERLDDGAPLVASLIGATRFGITMASLPQSPALPKYSPSSLAALVAGGHLAATRSISKGWALWQAVTGDPNWPVSTFRAYQEIAWTVYNTLEPLLGESNIDQGALSRQLGNSLAGVTGSRVVRWQLQLSGDTLYCFLEFVPYGEVRAVSAQLSLGTAATIDPV